MGASATAGVSCPSADWVEIVDGAVYASCGVQIDPATVQPVAIAIAAAKPSASSDDYIVLRLDGDESIPLDLDAADSVWAKGVNGTSKVRLYKVAR